MMVGEDAKYHELKLHHEGSFPEINASRRAPLMLINVNETKAVDDK